MCLLIQLSYPKWPTRILLKLLNSYELVTVPTDLQQDGEIIRILVLQTRYRPWIAASKMPFAMQKSNFFSHIELEHSMPPLQLSMPIRRGLYPTHR